MGYIDQSGIGQFTDFCVYDKNEPGKKSQKPSLEVDFSLVTIATYVWLWHLTSIGDMAKYKPITLVCHNYDKKYIYSLQLLINFDRSIGTSHINNRTFQLRRSLSAVINQIEQTRKHNPDIIAIVDTL